MGGGLPGSQSAIEDDFHSGQIDDNGQLPEEQTALQGLQHTLEQMTRALEQMVGTLQQVARNTSSTNDQLKRQNGLLQATADHVSKKMTELAERVEGYLVGPHPAQPTDGYPDFHFSTE
ncbi:hypothetical protein NKR19_g9490 [Coniochaeta hoffmannii]|uniref:Uncharacterized protein n=1 Tax=Coniochaeta hoffmannii TaxID=91930 RepID=A0AA38RBL1_9PEZI|nr:hypothetical protein NKR19_g9490 [Coniochaeta hoffmannii]